MVHVFCCDGGRLDNTHTGLTGSSDASGKTLRLLGCSGGGGVCVEGWAGACEGLLRGGPAKKRSFLRHTTTFSSFPDQADVGVLL